eukprot:SAG31_NODE_10525_length_1128_cov_1.671526_2_plen_169_part_00
MTKGGAVKRHLAVLLMATHASLQGASSVQMADVAVHVAVVLGGAAAAATASAPRAAENGPAVLDLLALGGVALDEGRFQLATERFRAAIQMSEARAGSSLASQSALVSAAEGLNTCGEVVFAAQTFEHALAELQVRAVTLSFLCNYLTLIETGDFNRQKYGTNRACAC